jgi:prevent-host-death family protein
MSGRRQARDRSSGATAPGARTAAATKSEEATTVTATEAQNEFGRVFDTALRDQVVVITKHNAPRAVLLSIDRYNALVGASAAALDTLTSEFDTLLERMQSSTARAAMQRAFNASPGKLGPMAVEEAKPRARAR